MRILFAAALVLLSSTAFADEVEMHDQTMLYQPPDSSCWNIVMDEFDKDTGVGIRMFKRSPLIDPEGNAIEPVIAVIYEKLPSDSEDLIVYSTRLRATQGARFQIDSIEPPQKLGMKYERAIFYDGHYLKGPVRHEILVVHMMKGDIGVQIICDSTDGVYDRVAEDMMAFIRSISFAEPNMNSGP